MISIQEEDRLKKELVGLFGHMNKMRRELAVLQGDDAGSFVTMADTLDAIVENTETASNTILESMEAIEEIVGELRQSKDPAVLAVCGRISERSNQVFEACSFQDLTGQRITRVVNSLKFIEERITSMVRMWGKEELAKVVEEVKQEQEANPVDEDKTLLHGPQRDGVAHTQAEVDKLFSQDDIDKLFG
ncbi:protein phosphatase CheZ [Telmatospirillum siberiense]|uniref:Chemotaxis protein n=1 Tax=Telmatospirillum siberiense TaxID=382514 RepID=A0A2N3PML5_9PROT|nr:protein phosphatase CheZ [Telmatospirillum siberiense]PKU21646.1 chemotaxis protein [Telmatospirillum siberiense]